MSELAQLGPATHLPGAQVRVVGIERHYDKTGVVVGRVQHLGEWMPMVRVTKVKEEHGKPVKPQIVHIYAPDHALERTPQSLVVKVRNLGRTLLNTLAGPVDGGRTARTAVYEAVTLAVRKRYTTREVLARGSRRQMAAASRKRNRR